MKKCLSFAIGLLLISIPAGADTSIDETRPAQLDGIVRIDNVSGSVEVVGWDKPEIHLVGRLQKNVERVDFDVHDGRASIKVVIPKRPQREKAAYLTVHVPQGSGLEIHTVSADTETEGVRAAMDVESVSGGVEIEMPSKGKPTQQAEREEGVQADEDSGGLLALPSEQRPTRVRVKTVSGDIRVEAEADSVTLQAVSGDIAFVGEAGQLQAETVSGDLRLSGDIGGLASRAVSGDISASGIGQAVEASTSSGDVKVSGQALERAEVNTVSGDIELKCALAPAGRMDLSASSGDVEVQFIEKVEAEFSLETSSGDFDIDMGPVTMEGKISKREMRFSTGSAAGAVHIETTSGAISLTAE